MSTEADASLEEAPAITEEIPDPIAKHPSKHGTLPGGFLHERQVYRDITFREMTGKVREGIGDPQLTKNVPKLIDHVLSHCIESIGPISKVDQGVLDRMLIGDKDYCILKLFHVSNNPNDPPVVPFTCSSCSKKIDGVIDVTDFEIYDIEDALDSITTVGYGREEREVRTFSVDIPEYEIKARFRHGDGFDQRSLHKLAFGNPLAAQSALLAMNLVTMEYQGKKAKPGLEKNVLDDMTDGAIKSLEAGYFAGACGVELEHIVECFHCGKGTEVTFTVLDFLFRPKKVSRKSKRKFS